MNNVLITPRKDSTSLVNKFTGSEDKGYILLKETKIEFGKGWAAPKTRTALLKGTIEVLEMIIRSSVKLSLPGRIVVQEFVRSEVPTALALEFFNQNVDEDEAVRPYLKNTGGEHPIALTVNGEEIVRFAYYDSQGQDTDTTVEHDNGAEVSIARKNERAAIAVFPGAGEK